MPRCGISHIASFACGYVALTDWKTIGARWRAAFSLLFGPPKTEAALKLHRVAIADPAYLQNCGFLITGARSLTPAKSIDVPLSLSASSQHP
jgi:hypothetical protein